MSREDERARRIGLNEAVFREVNERLSDLERRFHVAAGDLEIVCECGDAECTERIRVDQPAYEELRADPRLFAVVPGHEEADVEEVLEQSGAYDVVRKHEGVPTKIAAETDRRTG
jgi:hypothetical protein